MCEGVRMDDKHNMPTIREIDPVLAGQLASLWMHEDVRKLVDQYVSDAMRTVYVVRYIDGDFSSIQSCFSTEERAKEESAKLNEKLKNTSAYSEYQSLVVER